jgi:hypothetical protein
LISLERIIDVEWYFVCSADRLFKKAVARKSNCQLPHWTTGTGSAKAVCELDRSD